MKEELRMAVIGAGNMGREHLGDLASMEGVRLAAVCDIDPARAAAAAAKYGIEAFASAGALLDSGLVDAVTIATPHYDHPTIAALAFARGVHVLSEKPIAVHGQGVRLMTEAYEAARKRHPGLVFSAMFQQRTQGNWMRVKEILAAGGLGRIVRASWIVTDWFRTQAYYDSGGWRATWKGEGGGVLMNQCPHNLDLFQWFFGLPARVTAFASLGKYHDIEVEDEVTAYLEYADGMVGHFITSTGESPGSNRLEIVGELGRLVCEGGRLRLAKNERSMLVHLREAPGAWDALASSEAELPFEGPMRGNHRIVLEDFAAAAREGRPPRIDGREGAAMVELDNAIMLSSLEGRGVDLPLAPGAWEERLAGLCATSRFVKKTASPQASPQAPSEGFERSYGGR
jgi:predicted dehydrogenase